MSFSAGVYTLPTPALVPGQTVSSSENNTVRNDMAASFNLTWLRNGTAAATANIPMGSYKLTGLGAATTSGDALSYGNAAVVTTLTSTSLTATRVPYAGTGGLLQDASTFTFDGTTLTAGGFSGPHNGTVGATTPNTGAFTTLSASSTVSGTGFSTYLASPPAIGGTAAAAGSFTTLTTSSTVTVNGGTANGVAYLNGSKVLTTGSAITFDGTNFATTGTASATKLIPTGGTATGNGMYLSTTNTLAWSTNGSQAMTLDASGNLGIGTNSPAFKLEVISGTNNGIHLKDAASATVYGGLFTQSANLALVTRSNHALTFGTNDTERMRIDSSGNVGIGTSSPGWKLDVRGTAAFGDQANCSVFLSTTSATEGRIQVGGKTSVISSNMTFYTSDGGSNYERMRIDSSGYLLVGYTSSNGAYKLQVNSQIFATNATIATSDGRYKENVQPVSDALNVINALNPVTFNWKQHPVHAFDTQTPAIGFIAQEVQQALADKPYLDSIVKSNEVTLPNETKEEFLGLAEGALIPVLVKAIQELKAELDATKAEVAALKQGV